MPTPLSRTVPVDIHNATNYVTTYFNGQNYGVDRNQLFTKVNYGNYVKSGWKNENFAFRVARRLDASSQYSTHGYVKLIPAHISGKSLVTSGSNIRYDSSGYSHVSYLEKNVYVPSDAALSDLALQRLKNKLQRHTGDFNAVIPTVELRELRGTIKQLAELSYGYILHYASLRKKLLTKLGRSVVDPRSRKRMISNLQDSWLTWSFGVKPLVMDGQKAIQAIDNFIFRSDHSVRLAGSAEKEWIGGGTTSGGQTALNACPLFMTTTFKHTLSYRWIAAAELLLRSSNDYTWDSTFGFKASTAPSLFYELTPFSWVLDYFTTMGDFMNDTFELPSGSTYYIVRDTRYTREGIENPFYKPIVDPSLKMCLTTSVKAGESEYVSFKRDVGYANLPRVGLHLKSVDQVGWNAVNKLLNLTSILKLS